VTKARVFALIAAMACTSALAGRPLTTEDAAIVDAKSCQLETWIDRATHTTTGWLVPACNFGANIEWQIGFARTRFDGESRYSESYAQVKTLVREMTDAEPWSVGLVAGVTRRPLNPSYNGWHHPYVVVPFSQVLCRTPFTFHADIGWARYHDQRRDVTLWGVAVEAAVHERAVLLAESFGENSRKPFVRLGGRWTAIRQHMDVDLSWVARPGGPRDERLVSLGVTLQTGAFMP